MDGPEQTNRRPIPQRRALWAIRLTRGLQRIGATPNGISLLGLGFALVAAACLVLSGRGDDGPRALLLILAAILMPLRLICNMLDGMLAVEGGMQGRTGMLYNELPDRLADLAVIAAAGYAAVSFSWGPDLGWAAAASALLVAYVRTLGAAAGAGEHFDGPMAKPRRMHVLIAACLLSLLEPALGWPRGVVLAAALAVVLAGDIATIARRLAKIVAALERS